MKQRKSNNYLVISCSYMGVDEEILKIYSQAAKFYNAQVVHLGRTASEEELRKYISLTKSISTATEAIGAMEDSTARDRRMDAMLELSSEQTEMKELEQSRIEQLEKHFGSVWYVTTPDLTIGKNFEKSNNCKHFKAGVELSRHLFLSPISPSGDRVTRSPVTSISVDFLKSCGRSWIVPHPVPIVEPYAQPGLNEAYNYYTTGCLKHSEAPTSTKNQYKFAHMPCAIMVLVDKQNGEFHAKQMHVDKIDGVSAVLDDGIIFTQKGHKELNSADKAVASSDDHAPWTHPGVLGAVRALNSLHKPETFLNLGDAADFASVNRHAEGMPGQLEGLRLADDLNNLRRLLDAQTSSPSIKNKVLIDSNHHEWLSQLVEKIPSLKGLLDWKTIASSRFSDWKVQRRTAGEPEIYKFGDFTIRHGDQDGGIRKAERTFPKGKYLCGHWHKYGTYRRSIMMGCGTKLGPKYVGGQVNNWQSQASVLTKNGDVAAVNAKIILHDERKKTSRFGYRGNIYETDWYDIF